jgi:hypothetical protein
VATDRHDEMQSKICTSVARVKRLVDSGLAIVASMAPVDGVKDQVRIAGSRTYERPSRRSESHRGKVTCVSRNVSSNEMTVPGW